MWLEARNESRRAESAESARWSFAFSLGAAKVPRRARPAGYFSRTNMVGESSYPTQIGEPHQSSLANPAALDEDVRVRAQSELLPLQEGFEGGTHAVCPPEARVAANDKSSIRRRSRAHSEAD